MGPPRGAAPGVAKTTKRLFAARCGVRTIGVAHSARAAADAPRCAVGLALAVAACASRRRAAARGPPWFACFFLHLHRVGAPPRSSCWCGGARRPARATAPQRAAEPAWHRRLRRQRGAARTLLRVSAAAGLLASHHSAQRHHGGSPMPNNRGAQRGNGGGGGGGGGGLDHGGNEHNGRWTCLVCGIEGNFATRYRCRNCDGYRPSNSISTGGGTRGGSGGGTGGGSNAWRGSGNGGGGGGSARGGGSSTTSSSLSFAERQLNRQRAEQKDQQQLAAARRQAEQLRAANLKLQQELAAAREANGGVEDGADEEMEGMECEESADAMSEEDRQKRVETIRNGLAYLELQYGADSPELNKAKGDIETLQRASRESKPYKTHRAQLEKKKDRLQKQQAKASEEADELLNQIEVLQARLNKTRDEIEARSKQITSVDEELKELLRKALAEGTNEDTTTRAAGEPKTPEAAEAAWNTVSSTLTAMAARPGVPPGLAEQVSMLLGQIRIAATAIHQQAAGASRPPAQPAEAKPAGKQGGAGHEPTGRRWLGPGGGIGGNKPAWGNQAGRSSEAASSTQLQHPAPTPLPKTPGQTGQLAATWKLASDAAAATEQERAVAAAAREAAAAADASATATANAAPNDRHGEKEDGEKNDGTGGGGSGGEPSPQGRGDGK